VYIDSLCIRSRYALQIGRREACLVLSILPPPAERTYDIAIVQSYLAVLDWPRLDHFTSMVENP
jgi:hypothetical protein